eukprot:scaffold3216_cov177-Ochromonas_danica.AAC.2
MTTAWGSITLLLVFCYTLAVSGVTPRRSRPVMQGRLSDPSSTTLLRSFSSKVHLYLGTGSATRREILAREGFTFEVHKANIDEKAFGDRAADPDDLVRLLAIEKSRAILRQWQLSSSPSPTPAPSITHHRIPLLLTADQVVATIHFDQIPEEVVDRLLSDGQALHCAGGLMVEHPLLQPYIKRIDGTMDSVMGLSCELLEKLLIELDLPLPQS